MVYEPDDDEPPSRAVPAVVAALTDRTRLELEPLARTVDPDALDGLYGDRGSDSGPLVRFEYERCAVTVYGDGRIAATKLADD